MNLYPWSTRKDALVSRSRIQSTTYQTLSDFFGPLRWVLSHCATHLLNTAFTELTTSTSLDTLLRTRESCGFNESNARLKLPVDHLWLAQTGKADHLTGSNDVNESSSTYPSLYLNRLYSNETPKDEDLGSRAFYPFISCTFILS